MFNSQNYKIHKQQQQNSITVNIRKAIPKYYNGVFVVSTFSFAHFLNTSFFDLYHYCIQ